MKKQNRVKNRKDDSKNKRRPYYDVQSLKNKKKAEQKQ